MPVHSPNKCNLRQANNYPLRSPRFWHGMRTYLWWSLLFRNGFSISPRRLHLLLGVSCFTPLNDILGLAQEVIYGRKIRHTAIDVDPVFILGHWRSGTTLLHELLVSNQRFASPTTFQCFAPWHFLLTESLMVRFGGFLLPERRPMDNMVAGWNLPQEDEFALMILGAPTPYLRLAFPRRASPFINMLDMDQVPAGELRQWRATFLWFVKALTLKYHKQLVMKSPPHTGRISELAKLFPQAKFIHLTRDPRMLFLSTLKLWRALEDVQSLQTPVEDERLREYVWCCFNRMYAAFEAQRNQVAASRIVDVRYEDLIEQPLATMESIYKSLDLGDFEAARPALQERLRDHEKYRVNKHLIDEQTEREILDRWGDYARKYGYL